MAIAMESGGRAAAHDCFDEAAWTARELSTWLGLVYQGLSEATPWASLLEAIRAQFDASFTTLVLRSPRSTRRGLIINASAHGPLLPGEPSYSEQFYALCPFVDLPPGQVFTADALYGDEAWRAHDFYRQYLQPLDLRYILGANLRGDDGVDTCNDVVLFNHFRPLSSSLRCVVRAPPPPC